MDQPGYSRLPEAVGEPYPKDKTWGTAIVALSTLGLCGGALFTASGVAIGSTRRVENGHFVGDGTGLGAIFAFLGVVSALICFVSCIGGVGIRRGARWGFWLTGVLAAVNVLLSLLWLPFGIVGLVVGGLILYYCFARLTGREGPKPV